MLVFFGFNTFILLWGKGRGGGGGVRVRPRGGGGGVGGCQGAAPGLTLCHF